MWARIHLIPALQAEEDRDQVRRYLADQAREKELLGENTRVYNSDRYVQLVGLLFGRRYGPTNERYLGLSDQRLRLRRNTLRNRETVWSGKPLANTGKRVYISGSSLCGDGRYGEYCIKNKDYLGTRIVPRLFNLYNELSRLLS
jgi:hypothetical protein